MRSEHSELLVARPQKAGKNGEKMGEIRPKTCQGGELTENQLAALRAAGQGGAWALPYWPAGLDERDRQRSDCSS